MKLFFYVDKLTFKNKISKIKFNNLNMFKWIGKNQENEIFDLLNTQKEIFKNLKIEEWMENATLQEKREVKKFIEERMGDFVVTNMKQMFENNKKTIFKYLVELTNEKWDFFYIVVNFALWVPFWEWWYWSYWGWYWKPKWFYNLFFKEWVINSKMLMIENELWIKFKPLVIYYWAKNWKNCKHSIFQSCDWKKKYLRDYEEFSWSKEFFADKYEQIFEQIFKKQKRWKYTKMFVEKEKFSQDKQENYGDVAFMNFFLTFTNFWKFERFWDEPNIFMFHKEPFKKSKVNISCNSNLISEDLAEKIYWKIFDYFYDEIYLPMLLEQMENIRNRYKVEPNAIKTIRWVTEEIKQEFSETFEKAFLLEQKQRKLLFLTEEIKKIESEIKDLMKK